LAREFDDLKEDGTATEFVSEGGRGLAYTLDGPIRDGDSFEGTKDPGPAYCLLDFGGLGVTFFSGGGACRE